MPYDIYVHGETDTGISKTNPRYERVSPKTYAEPAKERERGYNHHRVTPTKAAALSLATISKINSYIGEYTENRVAERRAAVGLTIAGFVSTAIFWNPYVAVAGAALLAADKAISYELKVNKENLSSDYLRQLRTGSASKR